MSQFTLPISKAGQDNPSKILSDFLERYPNVEVILFHSIDLVGVTRWRLLPVKTFKAHIDNGKPISHPPLDLTRGCFFGLPPALFENFATRAYTVPDLISLRPAFHDAAKLGNTAMCTGNMDLDAVDLDLRGKLIRTTAVALDKHNLTFLLGFEIEWVLLDPETLEAPEPRGVPVLQSRYWAVINQTVVALAEAGIAVTQCIREGGEGAASQFEVALPPLPPLEAVDAYVYARVAIRNVARQHGLVATFYPAGYANLDGPASTTGTHIHISATPAERAGDDFAKGWDPDTVLAGILSHITALAAVGLAQVDSYKRVKPNGLMAGYYVAWGDNHRDCVARKIEANHWEIRCHDGTSNPYAYVTGLIAAACDRKPLTIPETTKWITFMSDEERKRWESHETLPKSLSEALDKFEEAKEWIVETFGEGYFRWYLELKRLDLEKSDQLEFSERRRALINLY